jgi:hypothetical protein
MIFDFLMLSQVHFSTLPWSLGSVDIEDNPLCRSEAVLSAYNFQPTGHGLEFYYVRPRFYISALLSILLLIMVYFYGISDASTVDTSRPYCPILLWVPSPSSFQVRGLFTNSSRRRSFPPWVATGLWLSL